MHGVLALVLGVGVGLLAWACADGGDAHLRTLGGVGAGAVAGGAAVDGLPGWFATMEIWSLQAEPVPAAASPPGGIGISQSNIADT